jgi:hypothetical protein
VAGIGGNGGFGGGGGLGGESGDDGGSTGGRGGFGNLTSNNAGSRGSGGDGGWSYTVYDADPDDGFEPLLTRNIFNIGFSGSGGFYDGSRGQALIANFDPGEQFETYCFSSDNIVPRYRLYNPNDFHHHYTTDENEYHTLGNIGWNQEGISSCLYDEKRTLESVDAVPYLRLYNPNSSEHHWTTDANEYNVLGTVGWIQEGEDGYVFPSQVRGSEPLYRLYNPNDGLHHWTMDTNERTVLIGYGWVDEGIACYVFP